MSDTPAAEPAPPPDSDVSFFLRRMQITALSILLLVLVIHLLEKFRDVLQPLFVALFIGFLMHPIHRWLMARGIRSTSAYGVILTLVALTVAALGSLMYANITRVADNLIFYEEKLEKRIVDLAEKLPIATPKLEKHFLREVVAPDQVASAMAAVLGRFGDFTALLAITLVYLLFLVAEKVNFPDRMEKAFGPERGAHIMDVVESITQAIGQYIAVKTVVSAIAGLLSYLVLVMFDVEFAATWGILIFLLNFIPYLGSLIAVTSPILLAFIQFDDIWKGIAIGISLVGIQQIIGFYIEPRMAGRRLDVSPLLIVLSLVFWGVVWGIVGMILAVPILVIAKIIFENINETKPIAKLISNR